MWNSFALHSRPRAASQGSDVLQCLRTGFSQAICASASWILAGSASSLVLSYPSMIGVSISPGTRAPPRLERPASVTVMQSRWRSNRPAHRRRLSAMSVLGTDGKPGPSPRSCSRIHWRWPAGAERNSVAGDSSRRQGRSRRCSPPPSQWPPEGAAFSFPQHGARGGNLRQTNARCGPISLASFRWARFSRSAETQSQGGLR